MTESLECARFNHIHNSAITVLKGTDSISILDRLVTTSLQGLKNLDRIQTLFCDANGRIEDFSTIIPIEGQILMTSHPQTSEQTRKKIIEGTSWDEDCTVYIGDGAIVHLSLVGPKNDDLSGLFVDVESLSEFSVSEFGDILISKSEYNGQYVVDFLIPKNEIEEISSKLKDFGSMQKPIDYWEYFRISNGMPSINDARGNLPSELGLSSLVSIGKGCYPGQEVHARLDSRGSKVRSMIRMISDEEISPGTYKSPEVGNIRITSNVHNNGEYASLAMCRIFEDDRLETSLIDGTRVTLENLPFD